MALFITPYATLSFPHLFSPKTRGDDKQEPVYSCSLLFDPNAQRSPEFKAIQEGCIAAAKERWGDSVKINSLKFPFKDAGEKADKYQGYEAGIIVVEAWTKQKPGIVDARKQDVLLPEQVYAGQLVRAQVKPFAWEVSGKRGVSLGLNNLQIVKHDAPRIDGRVAASAAFDEIDTDDEESPF
jgi:hypothetical protein